MTPARTRIKAAAYANCDAADWIEAWATAGGFDDDAKFAMRLCVDELVTNLMTHGLPDGRLDRSFELIADGDQGKARVMMIDDGIAFDVTGASDPGREDTIEAATVGGRGIRLIRAFAERLEWRRIDGRNETTLVFKTAKAPGT